MRAVHAIANTGRHTTTAVAFVVPVVAELVLCVFDFINCI